MTFMNDNALIIFVKNPVQGKVKTRLANDIGDEKALSVYNRLLAHTESVVRNIDADKYVYYADHINESDIWSTDIFNKKQQGGDGLGQRMSNAFQELFNKGSKKVIIIGSDCAELQLAILEDAYAELGNADVVIGPARDGGYYLLGMKNFHSQLFEGIEWSTDSVYPKTINKITSSGLNYVTLPELTDIDEIQDVPENWL